MRGKRGRGAGRKNFYFVLRTRNCKQKGGFAKFRLAKFRGIKRENFVLHLKEIEFRYNTKNLGQNLYQNLLKLIRENPVKFN